MLVREVPRHLRKSGVVVILDEALAVNPLDINDLPSGWEGLKKYPAETPVMFIDVPPWSGRDRDLAKVMFPDGIIAWVDMFNVSPLPPSEL